MGSPKSNGTAKVNDVTKAKVITPQKTQSNASSKPTKTAAGIGRRYFLTIAVLFHLIYAMSIFDIYFVSPIVHGMRAFDSVEPGSEAPSQRLVLFVGDGLRADKAFQSHPDPSPPPGTSAEEAAKPRHLMPFLRSKILTEGTFGVSHTRVPTESRPGHVALIAGLYEDVSAVTTGWKHNPVNFDSVFNRSRHTWSWGSPDILPMFKDGAVPGRIDAYTYGADAEDFTSDAIKLDIWVFDRVKALFEQAKTDAALDKQLRQDKVVFFLHLLGLDTTGHFFRPYSKEYLHNIKTVDQGVKEITELIEDFYQDGKTSYVFTADHGMSDWGSHGDGHPDNTRTPLITWGSGVAKPIPIKKKKGTAPGHEDGFSADWDLSHIPRHDVAQADVATLMAYLAGLELPVNSVGELPLDYLDATPKQKAQALLVNARQILEMYRVKEEQKKATRLRYVSYPGFGYEHKSPGRRVEVIQDLIKKDRNTEALQKAEELIQDALQGLRYLQTYDWLFLRTLVTLGYLGWIAFAATTIVDAHVLGGTTQPQRTLTSHIVVSSIAVALMATLVIQKASWSYYAYAVFPLFFWEQVNARRAALWRGKDTLFGRGKSGSVKLTVGIVSFTAILELLVQSYFERRVFSVCYLVGAAWPWLQGKDFVEKNKALVTSWVAASVSLSIFTLLPAIKVESLPLIMIGGFLMVMLGGLSLVYEEGLLPKSSRSPQRKYPYRRSFLGIQVGLTVLAMVVTYSSVTSLQARKGLPLGTQVVGWLTLIASLLIPFIHVLDPSPDYEHRLLINFLTFAPTFIILTISYEGLFYFAFCVLLVSWIRLEHSIYRYVTGHSTVAAAQPVPKPGQKGAPQASNTGQSSLSGPETPAKELLSPIAPLIAAASDPKPIHRALTAPDFRISLFTLYLLQSAFFSTGNIASVASFSLDAVYRLIPVFDPFSQGALLILKIIVPFAILSANLGVLNKLLGLERGALMMIVVGAADWLTLRFFWMVRDEGSWLEIGSSISMFCIASALCMFVAGLESVGEVMIRGVKVRDENDEVEKSE